MSEKICKIAFLIDTISCNTSGTEKQLLEIITRIKVQGYVPLLVCLRDSDWLRSNSLPCSYAILNYEGMLKLSIPRVVWKLRKLIIEQNIQLIQTFFEDSIFISWSATLFRKENTVLLSSRRDMGLGSGNQPWYHALYGMVLPFVNKRFDGLVVNSCQIKKYVAKREKVSLSKIEVVYNGVTIPQNNDCIPQVFEDSATSNIWLVIVASLTPVKRHDLLIEAVAQCANADINSKIKVLVLGKGPLRKQLVYLTKQYGVQDLFLFEGAVNNVSDYLIHCDIGILCSDREGLSNAILEYMACGLPVLATAVGGNTELVKNDNGICVPTNEPTFLADALLELIKNKNKRRQMGLVSKKRVEKDFSWKQSMQQLETYYQRKLQEKDLYK